MATATATMRERIGKANESYKENIIIYYYT